MSSVKIVRHLIEDVGRIARGYLKKQANYVDSEVTERSWTGGGKVRGDFRPLVAKHIVIYFSTILPFTTLAWIFWPFLKLSDKIPSERGSSMVLVTVRCISRAPNSSENPFSTSKS